MRVASWNVNSIRTRLSQVIAWLNAQATQEPIDLLCLQETKVVDADFPSDEFTQLGYHVYVSGQKSYNGVALISRDPIIDIQKGFTSVLGTEKVGSFDEQKRVIGGLIQGIRVINLYVPNGSEVGSDKYQYKLEWLDLLREYLTYWLSKPDPLWICGDFNIAPEDRDIYDPKKAGEIMASPPERDALAKIVGLGLQDVFRKFTTAGGYFSWWDYRSAAFVRNRGWRIDHHYLSQSLYERASQCVIDRDPRSNPQPSDHAPVIATV
ncbi:MAG: exodeoxyribonuclease III [Cyanobacteriota bacterium]|nr:exodeoxyribonuclease III [Cyanobacteriota bacterium]